MIERLKKFVERHPYLPLLIMAGLDVAGYMIEAPNGTSGEAVDLVGRLDEAFLSVGGFLAFFPEEIFVAFTAYGLSLKMRNLKEEELKAKDVLDKLKRTSESMESIWAQRSGSGKLLNR